ncbi:hypothetical protein N9251_02910 [Gammaproteobacteria bacterium]|jgi:hypothetical protein|nr:hypothetical protein [Gammaproteobacteria bacterium]
MDKEYTVAEIKIGEWVVSVIETIDQHKGEVMEREFICTSYDMREPSHSLIEAVEFAKSVTGLTALNSWVYVAILAKQAHEFYRERGFIA